MEKPFPIWWLIFSELPAKHLLWTTKIPFQAGIWEIACIKKLCPNTAFANQRSSFFFYAGHGTINQLNELSFTATKKEKFVPWRTIDRELSYHTYSMDTFCILDCYYSCTAIASNPMTTHILAAWHSELRGLCESFLTLARYLPRQMKFPMRYRMKLLVAATYQDFRVIIGWIPLCYLSTSRLLQLLLRQEFRLLVMPQVRA